MTRISDHAINTAKAVLAKCAANDPWFPQPSESTALAWAEQFMICNLPAEDLLAGVTAVYSTHGSGFHPLPADVIAATRQIRRDRAERESEDARRAREDVIDARVAEHIAELAAAKAIPDDELKFQRPRHNPLLVVCPHCQAPMWRPCTTAENTPLRTAPRYHPSRIDAAKQTAA